MSKDFRNTILKDLVILYIEDEINIRKNIGETLELLVKNVYACASYDEAITAYNKHKVNIIISDIQLGDKTGIDFCKEIRKTNTIIPIILLTAHLDTNYLLEATKLKLVDYLIKPISFNSLHEVLLKTIDELLVHNILKIRFNNGTVFDLNNKILISEENEIRLTSSEVFLLEFLFKNSSRVVSHEEIKVHIWKDSYLATDSALKNLLNKLRKKIGKESIENISGLGFRLIYKH